MTDTDERSAARDLTGPYAEALSNVKTISEPPETCTTSHCSCNHHWRRFVFGKLTLDSPATVRPVRHSPDERLCWSCTALMRERRNHQAICALRFILPTQTAATFAQDRSSFWSRPLCTPVFPTSLLKKHAGDRSPRDRKRYMVRRANSRRSGSVHETLTVACYLVSPGTVHTRF
jgi:hypothetical protein